MSGFAGNVVKKYKKSKGKKGNRNKKAIAKFKSGDSNAMIDIAMQYQLESTLANGNYY